MSDSTLKNLRARVREEADMEDSDFIEDTADSLDRRINEAGKKLYSLIANGGGLQFALPQEIVTVLGQSAYAMPFPAKRIHSVEFADEPISDFAFLERGVGRKRQPRFRLEGQTTLRISPAPSIIGPYIRVWYFPAWIDMVEETDKREVFDWEGFIILDAAISCSRKEEASNLQDMRTERDLLIQMIAAETGERYSGPDRIVDTGSYDRGAFCLSECEEDD